MIEPAASGPHPNGATAQARVLIDELVASGLTDLVLCPGSRSAPFAFAAADEPRLRVHLHIDERSAGFVALGLALASGHPAAVVVTSGTAVANLLPAAVEADMAGVPILLLTADRPPEQRDTGSDQTVAQTVMLSGSCRWTIDLGVAEDRPDAVRTWRAVAARAVAEARGLSGSAGPVHLNVPFREPTVPITDDGRTVGQPFTTETVTRPGIGRPHVEVIRPPRRLDDAAIAALADRFGAVERGLIAIGSGGGDHRVADAAHALATVTGWPVLAEGHTAARHRAGALRAWPHLVSDDGFSATHRPELVLRVGRAMLTRPFGHLLADATHEILLDEDGRWWDPHRTMSELVAADPAETMRRIAEMLAMPASSVWGDDWRAADAAVDTSLRDHLAAGGGQPGARVAGEVIARAPDGARLLVASSTAIRHIQAHVPARPDLHWFANRGAAGIDGTVSTALGLAIASASSDQREVVAIVGDLALLHDSNAWLLEAASDRLPITVVVLNDDGGTIFDRLPPGRFPAYRRFFATPHGRTFRHLADLHGIAYLPATPMTIAEALRTGETAPRLIDVALDPPDPSADVVLRTLVAETLGGLAEGGRSR